MTAEGSREIHGLFLVSHIVLGLIGVGLFLALLRKNKGSAEHVRIGRWYTICGWTLSASYGVLYVWMIFFPGVRGFEGQPLVSEVAKRISFAFALAVVVVHLVTLWNFSQTGKWLQSGTFGSKRIFFGTHFFGIAYCGWGAYLEFLQNNTFYAGFTAGLGFLLVIILAASWHFFREPGRIGWQFSHAISALTNGAILIRNLVGAGGLQRLLTWSQLPSGSQFIVVMSVNLSVLAGAYLAQAWIISVFFRRKKGLSNGAGLET